MAKVSFTAGRVQDFKCPPDKQQAFLWDSVTEGLGLRATAGSKNYVFQGKLAGQAIRIKIGGLDRYTIEDARKEARRLKTEIDVGSDPRIVKAEKVAVSVAKRKQTRAKQAPALDAWGKYLLAKAGSWSERYKDTHEQMSRAGGEKITRGKRSGMGDTKQQGALRPMLMLPLIEITRYRVETEITKIAQTRKETARLALALMRKFLAWCYDEGYETDEKDEDGRPKMVYPYRAQVNSDACARLGQKLLKKVAARKDALQNDQLAPWFEYVRRIENPTHAAYLQSLLLTGARRNELASLRWADVDFRWQSMTIRDKVEGERTIPLTPYVATLLQALKRLNETPPNVTQINRLQTKGEKWQPSPWVFSSPTAANGRIQEPRINHNRALAAAGLPPLSIHGLRRSFSTLTDTYEVPAGVAAQLMGHKASAIAEKHYIVRTLDQLRKWHTQIELWILEKAGIEQPSAEAGNLKLAASNA